LRPENFTFSGSGHPGLQRPVQRYQPLHDVLWIHPFWHFSVSHFLFLVRFGRGSLAKSCTSLEGRSEINIPPAAQRKIVVLRRLGKSAGWFFCVISIVFNDIGLLLLIRPIPRRLIQHPLPDDPGLAEVFLQHNAVAFRILLQR
jgi:hypothetical protein